MDIQINNIGIIEHINVHCDGVTLITGNNGSGKSTFGKAIDSLFVGMQNAPLIYVSALVKYFKTHIAQIVGFGDYGLERHYRFGVVNMRTFKSLYSILNSDRISLNFNYYDRLLNGVVREIEENREQFLIFLKTNNSFYEERDIDLIIRQLIDFRYEFESMFFDKEKIETYIGQGIFDQLNNSFIGQVKPLNKKETKTTISLVNKDFNVEFDYDSSTAYIDGDYSLYNCFYIDDGSIIDRLYKARRRKPGYSITKSLEEELLDKLESHSSNRDKVAANEKYKKIFDILNIVYPFEFILQYKSLLTTNNGVSIENEACGRKIFALIKEMLYRDLINENTVLIFDEPDNHLHPRWQNIFAKLLFEIAKTTGANVFCITHSPTLLLAFDVFSRDDETNEVSGLNVYYCNPTDKNNGFLDVSNDISKAHKGLSDPYIDLDLFGKDAI